MLMPRWARKLLAGKAHIALPASPDPAAGLAQTTKSRPFPALVLNGQGVLVFLAEPGGDGGAEYLYWRARAGTQTAPWN